MDTTAPQIYIFLITLYGGMLAGITYDIYRWIRKAIKKGRWLTALFDTLFIVTLALIVLVVMYVANAGELRLFTFVGFTLGFALYMAGLSPFILFMARKLKRWAIQRRIRKKG